MLAHLTKLLASLGLICTVTGSPSSRTSQPSEDDTHFIPYTNPIVIASTVDGKVSALDVQHGGLLWNIDLQKPLVASSISKLVYQQDGKSFRLIPSLRGGLFRFDGEGVEAVPFDADQLLSSSFRLAEETVLVGGKETTTCGVDVKDGRVLYSCTSHGCEQRQNVYDNHNILVIKRYQQTVRSIENRNGHENWNFSVGEIELNFSKGKPMHLLQQAQDMSGKDHVDCTEKKREKCETNEQQSFDASSTDRIKVIVPDGTICMVESSNKHLVTWKHQFKVPIASAWLLVDGVLHKLNLFDPARVPALDTAPETKPRPRDTVYMGKYDKYVYIQSSPTVERAISQAAIYNVPGATSDARYMSPRFSYRPYIAKAKQLTSAVVGQGVKTDGISSDLVVAGEAPDGGSCGSQLSVYEGDFDKDGGYYLQSDISYLSRIHSSKRKGRTTVESFENDSLHPYTIDLMYSSVVHRWRELLVLTVAISIITQCLIAKFMHVLRHRKELHSNSESSVYDVPPQQPPPFQQAIEREYESRFLQDFEPEESIGKGGFGVVFKARNKMDDCMYAVKRILLPKGINEREKVLREVRALAKLEHPSIVRYFNAWSEQPPPGWQEKQDLTLLKDVSAWTQTPYHETPDVPKIEQQSFNEPDIGDGNGRSQLSSQQSSTDTQTHQQAFDTTGAFSFGAGDAAESRGWTDGETGSSALPSTAGKLFQGGKFFASDSSSEATRSAIRKRNSCSAGNFDVPFKQYQQDSMSIVFDDGYSSKPNPNGFELDHQNSSNKPSSSPPSYEDIINADRLRKRSASSKGTSSSELNDVVCFKSTNRDDAVKSHQCAKSKESIGTGKIMYLYIQMQLCKKESLREWLASNTTKRDRLTCIDIFQQVVSAVVYVHDQNLIHRDLKPSNVLFSLDGTVKVGDFGLVTHAADARAFTKDMLLAESESTSRHTEKVGTRMYMAPEQMNSSSYSEKVDIYALGLILFELVHTFGTQMERVTHLSDARELKFPERFRKKSPLEADLARSMLLIEAAWRPSASEVSQHELFNALGDEGSERLNGFRRSRTTSSRSSDSLSNA